jgi:uncharacterized membrane protein
MGVAEKVRSAAPARVQHAWDYGEAVGSGKTRSVVHGQVATFTTVITIGILLIVGILLYSQVETALPTPENSKLDNASGNVTDGFADVMNLAPVVLIVLVVSLVISVVKNL